jgi:hypothetical protein
MGNLSWLLTLSCMRYITFLTDLLLRNNNRLLDMITILFLICYIIFINKRQAMKTADYKRRSVTSPQYTVQVSTISTRILHACTR